MAFKYKLEKIDSKYSTPLRVNAHVFLVKLRYSSDSQQNISSELLTMLDKLTAELKSGLDPENDCVFQSGAP